MKKSNWVKVSVVVGGLVVLAGCHVDEDVMLGKDSRDRRNFGKPYTPAQANSCYSSTSIDTEKTPWSASCEQPADLQMTRLEQDGALTVWVKPLKDKTYPQLTTLAYAAHIWGELDYSSDKIRYAYLSCQPSATGGATGEYRCTAPFAVSATKTDETDVQYTFYSVTTVNLACNATVTQKLDPGYHPDAQCDQLFDAKSGGTSAAGVVFPALYRKQ